MARPSLQRKLIAIVLTAVVAAWAVSTPLAVWQQVASQGAMRKQALLATAHVFGAAVSQATAAHDAQGAMQALRAIGQMPDIQYVEIRTVDGRSLATLGSVARLVGDATLEPDEDVSVFRLLTSGTIEVDVPIVNGGSIVGRLILI